MAYQSELSMQYPEYGMSQNDPMGLNAGSEAYNPQASSGGGGQTQFPTSQPLSYDGGGNYPSYDMAAGGGGTAGAVGDVADTASNVAMGFNPILGTGLKAVGLGASLYEKSQQKKAANKNYQAMMDEYKRRQGLERADRAQEAQRQQRQEGYFGADYARNIGTELAGDYQGYRQGGQQ